MAYEFTQDGYKQFSEDILKTNGEQGLMTAVLTDMQLTITEALATADATRADYEQMKAENDRLKESNMQLYLRNGEQAKQLSSINQGTMTPQMPEVPPEKKGIDSYMEKFLAGKK